MQRQITLGASLFALWLLLSGHFEPLLLTLGGLSTVLVVVIAERMRRARAREEASLSPRFVLRFVAYLPWLVKEIFVANMAVARAVLSPSLPISPIVVHFRGAQRTDLARFIYANSITLTPGTVTVDVVGQDLTVHALTRAAVDGHEEGLMVQRIARLESA